MNLFMIDESVIRIRVKSAQKNTFWYNEYIGSLFDVYEEKIKRFGSWHYLLFVNDWNKSYAKLVEEHGIGALLVDEADCEIVHYVSNEEAIHLLKEE